MNGKKKEPWRILVSAISITYIILMWTKRDVAGIYATTPKEAALPIIIIAIAIALLKAAIIAAAAFLSRRILGKGNNKNNRQIKL